MCQADGLNEGTFNFSIDIDTSVRMVFDIQWRRIDLSEPYHLLQTGEKIYNAYLLEAKQKPTFTPQAILFGKITHGYPRSLFILVRNSLKKH